MNGNGAGAALGMPVGSRHREKSGKGEGETLRRGAALREWQRLSGISGAGASCP